MEGQSEGSGRMPDLTAGVASVHYEPITNLPSAEFHSLPSYLQPKGDGLFSQAAMDMRNQLMAQNMQENTKAGGICGCMPCAPQLQQQMLPAPAHGLWQWSSGGKLKLTCEQPVVPVPVVQEVHRRDKIVEIPHVDVVDAVKPRVFSQGVEHEVPKMQINANTMNIEIPRFKYIETEVLVPIVTGYTHKFVPKWEVREVPRPVVKYVGKQEVIEVEVPQVKFVDKIVEREVVVDTIEKKVPKVIEVPKYVDTVQYVWKPVEKVVEVERLVPKFDVSLECPAPLIVPYPVQEVKEMPAVMVRKQPVELEATDIEVSSPEGTVRVPEEYIREYRKQQVQPSGMGHCSTSECCGVDVEDEVIYEQADNQTISRTLSQQSGYSLNANMNANAEEIRQLSDALQQN